MTKFSLEIEPSEVLHTEFGTAKIGNDGYYKITTGKYNMKPYHRVIYENFYGEIPPNQIIHHKDNNKLNNCLMNLKMMSVEEHIHLHHKGTSHSENHCMNISKSLNSTGYFRVYKKVDKKTKQGFVWCYQYYENGKQRGINRVNLLDLKQEVLKRGLKWYKYDIGGL